MTLKELENEVPELLNYTKTMPPQLRQLAYVKVYPPGRLIYQKDYALPFLGIVAKGENRVMNEFENGKIYTLETNKAIDFIGEVALLANMPKSSITIEALTANTIIHLPRREAETWINTDIHILRRMAEHVAAKLYRSSYNNGLKLYYPPIFLLADHLVRLYEQALPSAPFILQQTRERLSEELGMNIKTLDRTIRSMNKAGYFTLVKGKICITLEEYQKIKHYRETYKG